MKKLHKDLKEVIDNNYFDLIVKIESIDRGGILNYVKDGSMLICTIDHDTSEGIVELDLFKEQINLLIKNLEDLTNASVGFVIPDEQLRIFESDEFVIDYLDRRMKTFDLTLIQETN